MRILIVEDDLKLASLLEQGFREEGHTVFVCPDGATGLATAQASGADIVILDIMLPVIDGLAVARRLRAAGNTVPILMLTGRDANTDIVRGLDAGADDYLTKPFSFDVLLARIRALTRRTYHAHGQVLRTGDLVIDPGTHEVRRGGRAVHLTRTEFAILEFLIRRAGRVVPRQLLIDEVWGTDREISSNTLDAFIRLLRSKIDVAAEPKLIHTIRGIGYCVREGEPS
jgi:two-component system, OmpR family, response regulator MprA